jgi:predicted ArsR family transcriptional regulator
VTDAPFPPRVQRFLQMHIDSVEKLEVLLLLRAQSSRTWTARAVALQLRIAEPSAQGRLEDLCERGLLACEQKDQFRYAPLSSTDAQAVDELAATYAQRRVSVITFIFSQPMDRIRSFANAFRLKKDS